MRTKLADTNRARSEFAWTPSAELLETANVVRLAKTLGCSDYPGLHRVSVAEPDRFWRAVRDDLTIPFARDWTEVFDDTQGVEWTTWFTGARLNLAHACVHRWANERPGAEAAVWQAEDGNRSSLSWAELSLETTRLAEAFAALGIRKGDVVGIFLPMAPEAAIASHACAHIGAIQIADEALARAPAVEHVVVWRRLGGLETPMTPGRDHDWGELVAGSPGELPAEVVDSETPYLLAYTSGTTGRPKGALHVHGGFLLSIAREAAYQANLTTEDRVLFATDMGWIMGPWTVVGAGALGATTVFMEGAPDWPVDRIWKLVDAERVTMLGVSPTLVRALIPRGEPTTDLSSLRAVTTTGEPWNRGPYDWLNENVCGGGRIHEHRLAVAAAYRRRGSASDDRRHAARPRDGASSR